MWREKNLGDTYKIIYKQIHNLNYSTEELGWRAGCRGKGLHSN